MAIWYVDKLAVGANNGTSWTDAFATIAAAVAAVGAGDSVYIRNGPYYESVTATVAGTLTAPIRWYGCNAAGVVGTVVYIDGQSTRATGLTCNVAYNSFYYLGSQSHTSNGMSFTNATGLVLYGCVSMNNGARGIDGNNNAYSKIDRCTVLNPGTNGIIWNNSPTSLISRSLFAGATTTTMFTTCPVEDCLIVGDGVSTGVRLSTAKIERSTIVNCGIAVAGASTTGASYAYWCIIAHSTTGVQNESAGMNMVVANNYYYALTNFTGGTGTFDLLDNILSPSDPLANFANGNYTQAPGFPYAAVEIPLGDGVNSVYVSPGLQPSALSQADPADVLLGTVYASGTLIGTLEVSGGSGANRTLMATKIGRVM